jgi:hypothetical protein
MVDEKTASPAEREIRVLEIVGCFLMFFAILLLIGVDKAETTGDKVTNLVSALILLTIGGGMFWRGVVHHRRAWLLPLVLFTSLAVAAALVSFCLTKWLPAGEVREEPAVSEAETEEEPDSEDTGPTFFLTRGLEEAGAFLKKVVKRVSLDQVKLFAVIWFVAIAAVVWLVRRKTVFEGVTDRKWWRDLRLWTAVIMATQVIIYLLLGTYTPKKGEKSSQGASGEIHRSEALPGGSEEHPQQAQ